MTAAHVLTQLRHGVRVRAALRARLLQPRPRPSPGSLPPSLYAAVAIRCRRHRRHRRSRGGGDTRAARLGGARTGSSGGAARRRACRRLGRRARASDLTRRCERGSACAGRVTRATTRSFAARPRPPTLQEDTHQEVTHHVSSCGMACACAQARARLLRPRLRSPRPSYGRHGPRDRHRCLSRRRRRHRRVH